LKETLSPAVHAYREMMQLIAEGEFMPGDRLPTVPLARRFGVSRTPVTEVLKRMEGEGIVTFTLGSGARLIAPTAKEIRDTYFVRAHLESLALEVGFERVHRPMVIQLETFVEMEREYFNTGEKINCIQAGLDFHRELAKASGNDRLISYINNTLTASFVYLVLLEPARHSLAAQHPGQHHRLVELVTAGKKEEAVSFLRHHVLESCTINIPGL
jgi:DNA-binding GntR family transcriptional regulator